MSLWRSWHARAAVQAAAVSRWTAPTAKKAADRGKVLFRLDQNAPLRFSHENPAVQALYREYLDEPCSHRAEELLHCDHFAWQMDAAR